MRATHFSWIDSCGGGSVNLRLPPFAYYNGGEFFSHKRRKGVVIRGNKAMNKPRVSLKWRKLKTECSFTIELGASFRRYWEPIVLSMLFFYYAQRGTAQQHFVDETLTRLPQMEDVTIAAWFVDVDGDGDLDLVVENRLDELNPSYVIMNDGTGHFPLDSMRAIIEGAHWFSWGDVGDVDNDGDYDVIFASDHGDDTDKSRIFINNGGGFYIDETESRFPTNYPVNSSPQAVFLDCDNDMDLDALFAVEGWEILLMNLGNGFYDWDYDHRFPRNSDDSFSIVEGDVDGDFDIDVVIGNDGSDPSLIYINHDGYFNDETQERWAITPHFATGVCLSDIDGDGDLDLLASYGMGADYGIYVNDGEGYFTDETDSRIPTYGATSMRLFTADVDNDGDFDILVTMDVQLGIQMTSRLFINNGNGVFTDETEARLDSTEDNAYYASFGDIDNDGDVDLIICNMDPNDIWHPIGKQNRLLIDLSTPDSILPVIAKTLDYPDTGDTTNAYIISALAWDNVSVAPGELKMSVFYRTEQGGDFTELSMRDCGGFIYRRDIPAQPSGTKVEYYVKAVDKMGNISLDPETAPDSVYSFMVTGVGIEEGDPAGSIPKSFWLSQNYPNPFNPTTVISFDVPGISGKTAHVTLGVYDLRGKLVRELIDSDLTPGSHSAIWDGIDGKGERVPSGVYFYRLSSHDWTSTKKMALIK